MTAVKQSLKLALLASAVGCGADGSRATEHAAAPPALADAMVANAGDVTLPGVTDAMVPSAGDAGVPTDAGGDGRIQISCTVQSDCPDIDVNFFSAKACCTPLYACGYELPKADDITLQLFPQISEFAAMHTQGDPSGRCANASLFFGARPGLYEHRVELEDGGEILITPDCMSYTLAAFILPGCCLPDNSCGLSTDESYPTLEVLNDGAPAPFTRPECVPAQTLNQQLRESARLGAFARTTASGTCDYAALSARLRANP